jgi:hypothetical protein
MGLVLSWDAREKSQEVRVNLDGICIFARLTRRRLTVASGLHKDARVDMKSPGEAEDDGSTRVLDFIVFELREVSLAQTALRG